MGSALVYVVLVALVAGAVYLLVSLVFGRGEELAPMPPAATPTRLPARDLSGGDVRDLQFQQAVRGYKCSEVDWALERLAAEVDTLRARLDVLTAADPAGPAAHADPAGAGSVAPADVAPGHVGPAESDPADTGAGAATADDPDDPSPTDPTVAGRPRPRASGTGESAWPWRGRSGADVGNPSRRS